MKCPFVRFTEDEKVMILVVDGNLAIMLLKLRLTEGISETDLTPIIREEFRVRKKDVLTQQALRCVESCLQSYTQKGAMFATANFYDGRVFKEDQTTLQEHLHQEMAKAIRVLKLADWHIRQIRVIGIFEKRGVK